MNVKAIKTGAWSDPTVWNTGALPTSVDDVYANGYTITITNDITVASIRNSADSGSGVVAGGGFLCSTQNITINAARYSGTVTTAVLTISHNVGEVWVVGIGVSAIGSTCINSGNGIVNIIGDVQAGSSSQSAITNTGSGIVNFTGTGYGGTSNSNAVSNGGVGTINVTGNIVGGSATGSHGAYNGGFGTVNIIGNVSTTLGAYGAFNVGIGTINIIGSAIGGPAYGAVNNGGGTLRVKKAVAGSAISGVYGISTLGNTVVEEMEWGANGQVPVSGYVRLANANTILVQVRRENNTNVTLVDPSNIANQLPSPGDVRQGIVYAGGNNIGTLKVPTPENVRVGIETDNTVGTAALTPADIVEAVKEALPRFVNAATVQDVAIITSFITE